MAKKPRTMVAPGGFSITRDGIDRISQLPDEILHYILSFVKIVDVVRLSVLSRRWKSVWTTMPYLDFDTSHFYPQRLPNAERFKDFINWVLIYQGSTKITRFRLCCGNMFDRVQIMRWIRVAVLRDVRELELYFGTSEAFELPYCLSTCDSLRVLKLHSLGFALQLPSYLTFKHLTSLYLTDFHLNDEDLTRSFFSECRVLEDLSLDDFIMRNVMVLDISSASLKCLTIEDPWDNADYFLNCDIRISCPKLLCFTYKGRAPRNICLDNLSSLENVCIEMFPEYDPCSNKEVGHLLCKILEQVENIRVLKLHIGVMWSLCHIIKELQSFSTTFRRLKFLNFSLEIDGCCTQGMFLLLKHCPNLESLTLVIEVTDAYGERNEYWQLHDDGSASWESRLKLVRLINFKGEEHELRFVKFMLKNGLVLEKFIVIWSEFVEKSLATEETVLKFRKASSLVEVKIVPYQGG